VFFLVNGQCKFQMLPQATPGACWRAHCVVAATLARLKHVASAVTGAPVPHSRRLARVLHGLRGLAFCSLAFSLIAHLPLTRRHATQLQVTI
jgi:hypothetical protein